MTNDFNWRSIAAIISFVGLVFAGSVQATEQEDFFQACKNDNATAVSKYLERGMDPNLVDSTGSSALVLATIAESNKVVKLLASQPKIDINNAGTTGETAIAVAALRNNRELVDLFLSKGAKLDNPGWTAMHYAASAGHLDMVNYLISKKAALDPLSANKTTPMMMAARGRQTHVVKALLAAGANPSAVNDAGLSTADYLERHKETELAADVRKRAQNK
jgi:uncharacterized protein